MSIARDSSTPLDPPESSTGFSTWPRKSTLEQGVCDIMERDPKKNRRRQRRQAKRTGMPCSPHLKPSIRPGTWLAQLRFSPSRAVAVKMSTDASCARIEYL